MIRFKNFLTIFLIIIFLNNCGYTPRYAINKNLGFSIDLTEISGDREFNNFLKSKLTRYASKESDDKKNYKLNLKTEYKKNVKSRDAAGLTEEYELIITVDALIKSELMESKKIIFEEKFDMKKYEDAFEEKNYEKIIKDNFSDIISERIIFYLFKL